MKLKLEVLGSCVAQNFCSRALKSCIKCLAPNVNMSELTASRTHHMATTVEEDRAIRLAKQATDLVGTGRAEVSTPLNVATAVADWWGARTELEP